jgi:serine/threonine-protein kinase HipA
MRRTIRVALGENARSLGALRFDAQGSRESTAFEYVAEWLAAADGFAIGPSLPLMAGPQFHRKERGGSVFHGAIADTEPDGWALRVILRDHAKRRQEARRAGSDVENRPLNALDLLLAVDDASRVRALRFQDEDGVFQRAAEEGRRTAPPLIELRQLLSASHAVETNSETAADLRYLRGRGTSLGGLRPKCTVLDDDGRLSVASSRAWPMTGRSLRARSWHCDWPRPQGSTQPRAALVESEGQSVALIRRFDRTAGGGRLMYVSAATMLGVDVAESAEHAYTEIVDALRMHGTAPQADAEELWRRIAFSILVTNVDDHLRNHGFLHVDRGQWRLAPAFDVNPFPDRVHELKTWVSEEAGPEATIEALMSVLPYFRIPLPRARDFLRQVERAVSQWRAVGRSLGMSAQELDQLTDEHEERAAARNASQ